VAQQLESEEITVGILLSASLVERREILRSMGLRFGQIMSLNQALEHRQQGAAAEGGGAAEVGSEGEGETETESESEAGDTPAVAAVLPTCGPKLQAAAVLLRGAEVHTLKGLHVYLNNVLRHPDKVGFRTIQLANPLFQQRVWSAPGGASALRAAGFSEGQRRTLRLPDAAPLEPLRAAREMVEELLAELYPGSLDAPSLQQDLEAEIARSSEAEISAAVPLEARRGNHHAGACRSGAHGAAPTTPAVGTQGSQRASDTPDPRKRGFNVAAAAAAATASAAMSAAATAAGAAATAVQDGRAAAAVVSIESMLDGAHTASWDAVLGAVGLSDPTRLSAAEIRRCRACGRIVRVPASHGGATAHRPRPLGATLPGCEAALRTRDKPPSRPGPEWGGCSGPTAAQLCGS